VSQNAKARGEEELQRSFQYVSRQQVFPSGQGSHYIHIRYPDGQQPSASTDHVQAAVDEVLQAWEQAQEQAQAQAKAAQTIQASEITDANPWLRMTGWADYLQGISEKNLLECVETPEEDPQDTTEQRVQVIWATIEQIARKSQRTVQQCGQAIWVEAVRSEKGQTPYRPLLAYMDEAASQKHVHPWQQILAFIARTQAPHDWTSPKYGMTRPAAQEKAAVMAACGPDPPEQPRSHGSRDGRPADGGMGHDRHGNGMLRVLY